MNCLKCGKELTGKQTKYCSYRCQQNYLKVFYRQRNKDKLNAYARKVRRGLISSEKVPKAIKKNILSESLCIRCGTNKDINIHHIKPLSRGGNNHPSNLTTLCFTCHMKWHKIFPESYWVL